MIDISDLSVVKPHEVEPGTVLLGGAHFDDPPMFIFRFRETRFWFELSGARPFIGHAMAVNLHPYIMAGNPTLLVDVGSIASPQRGDIPLGAAVLIDDEACFSIQLNYGTAYVRTDGTMIEDPRSFDKLVAFTRWQLVVPAFGEDEWLIVHEAGEQGEADG